MPAGALACSQSRRPGAGSGRRCGPGRISRILPEGARVRRRARCSTWLYGILVRTIAERRRSSWRDHDSEDIDSVVESRFDAQGRWTTPPHGPDRELALAEIREQLADCLGAVPDRQRLAFQLREVEGLSTDEVCNILEVKPNNLGVLLFRARNRLRECLERNGIEGSGDAVV